ncbi:hypothetical protein FHS79_003082 [Polymorphobacter multimanifer]|uniref:DUF2796 domain-containing protein n=1 Tax=Polymorphobacter multimanifer TaxID=1070431 RepID=A0A841L7C6_9SPHN|nr:DUF6702 family protein [Polymorphobacter multimanifer]MBB6228889.1 hypothetical protein [Polymorphobacter multimanifer]
MRLLVAAAAALLAISPAAAHRGHASLSVVWIADNGNVTVTHRFSAHDLEPALVAIAPEAQPSLDDPEALAALTAYVGRRFQLQGAALKLQSRTLAGDDVTFVFAGKMPRRPQVTVRASFFGETHPGHSAQVNIRQNGITRSLWFKPSDGPQSVTFAKP